jgi:hypothetical protein
MAQYSPTAPATESPQPSKLIYNNLAYKAVSFTTAYAPPRLLYRTLSRVLVDLGDFRLSDPSSKADDLEALKISKSNAS